jgi:glutathione S-transferase
MAPRLYYHPASNHARLPRLVARELGISLDETLIDLAKGEHMRPEYLAKNPNHMVPTLEEDGFVLWESNSIARYLAGKKPEHGLYPTDARARADVDRWLDWKLAHLGSATGILAWERFGKPAFMKQEADPRLVAFGEDLLAQFAGVLDRHLAGRQHVAGGRLTLADFSLATAFMYRRVSGVSLASYANIEGWLAAIESRASWKETDPGF